MTGRGPTEPPLEAILECAGIEYTRPEIERSDPCNLDFRVTSLDLYIECKRRGVGKLTRQIQKVPRSKTVIALFGPNAAADLYRLAVLLAGTRE